MESSVFSKHFNDADGNPAGGTTYGNGFAIGWQNGPLGRHAPECKPEDGPCAHPDCTRIEPNGALVEDVISAVIHRIRFYQGSKFECRENEEALRHLSKAFVILNGRTADREKRKVEGTHNQ